MILGTGTRAVYTMSLPSSCDIELDSPVCRHSATRCGRAMSQMPWAAMYAVPSSSVFVVSEYAPFDKRVYPSCSSVISRRRAVGRARPVRVATSLTVSSIDVGPNALMTSRPRASASTKSALPLRLFGSSASGVHSVVPVSVDSLSIHAHVGTMMTIRRRSSESRPADPVALGGLRSTG